MPKVRKAELSFLYATCRLVLFYIATKYHHPKGIQVTERTRSFTPTPTPMLTPTGSVPKTICTPRPLFGVGGGGYIILNRPLVKYMSVSAHFECASPIYTNTADSNGRS